MAERLNDTDLEKVNQEVRKRIGELHKQASQLSIGGAHKSGPSQERYEASLRAASFLSGVQLGIEIAIGREDEIKFGQTVNLNVNEIVQE